MRKTSLKLTKTKVDGRSYYCVTVPKLGGGRTRRFFKASPDGKREAETFLQISKTQQQNFGTASLSLPEPVRIEATECSRKLSEHGKTITDATNFFLAHLKTVATSRTVQDAVAELLKARAADGMSTAYLHDLRIRLGSFARVFGDRMVAAIGAREISDWLRSLPVGAVSRNTVRRRLSTLFVFAKKNGYVTENRIADVEKAKECDGEIEILSVTETARLMEAASPETLPFWAIGAFAGLRRAEIERIDWRELDFEAGLIEVKAAKSKTASRRLIAMQPNLREWLAPYRNATGSVCPVGLRKKTEADRERARLRENWPSNALRHGFGSYHLAQFHDAAKLALEMGNSPAMIFKHYRELVRPKDAAKYWSIRPAANANVVAFAHASA